MADDDHSGEQRQTAVPDLEAGGGDASPSPRSEPAMRGALADDEAFDADSDSAQPDWSSVLDFETLQEIQDAFSSATGIPSVLTHPNGDPITRPSGEHPLCKALKGLPNPAHQCTAVHKALNDRAAERAAPTKGTCGRCGLVEASAPLIIAGHHVANWFCGPVQLQFVSEGKRAELTGELGRDPTPWLGTVNLSEDQFDRVLRLLWHVVRGISEQGTMVLQLHRDVVARERMERFLDNIINALGNPIFVKDERHRWLTVNSAFCDLIGVGRDQIIGKSDFDFFPVEEARVFWEKDDQVFRTGEGNANEEQFTDATGTTHTISTKKTVFEGDGGSRYLVGVIRDITRTRVVEIELARHRERLEDLVTERTLALSSANRLLQTEIDERRRAEAEKREVQAQLMHQQKLEAIGRLAGGVAHDFNNLLTGIFGHVTLAMREVEANPRAVDSLEQIREAAKRAAELTKQLLAFSRKQIIEPRVIDLNALVENLQRLLSRIIGEDVRLVTRYDPDLGRVLVDPGQLEQVIVNLAVNARDAMPDGGTLRIETVHREVREGTGRTEGDLAPGKYAVLVVSDTGVGMDEETRSLVFEPFFTTKPKGQGTGLGLATVYGIVKQHRGTILLSSELNEGTVFQVVLPCVESETQTVSAEARPTPLPTGSETILLVEDEDVVRLATEGMLKHLGYRVLAASDGDEALAKSSQSLDEIHLLMTDVVMPRMNGRELAEKLRTLRPSIKVLFTSGYTDDVIVHHGMLDDDVDFISKPFERDALAARVRKILDG